VMGAWAEAAMGAATRAAIARMRESCMGCGDS
jgi:hypothetical protein